MITSPRYTQEKERTPKKAQERQSNTAKTKVTKKQQNQVDYSALKKKKQTKKQQHRQKVLNESNILTSTERA